MRIENRVDGVVENGIAQFEPRGEKGDRCEYLGPINVLFPGHEEWEEEHDNDFPTGLDIEVAVHHFLCTIHPMAASSRTYIPMLAVVNNREYEIYYWLAALKTPMPKLLQLANSYRSTAGEKWKQDMGISSASAKAYFDYDKVNLYLSAAKVEELKTKATEVATL